MANHGAALFGQATLKNLLTDKLDLTLGLRVDYEKDALDFIDDRFPNEEMVRADEFSATFEFFEFLPKASLQYSWGTRLMSYCSVTRGYKSGGFNTTFEREEDQAFDPEFSWNYEAGVKGNMLSNRLNATLSLFYIDWKDLQVYQPIPSGRGSMLKNAASASSTGLELELGAVPVNNWRITASLGYAHALFREFKPIPEEDLDFAGNRIPYVPDLTGFFSTSYRIPFTSDYFDDLVLALNWRQTGTIYWNDANDYHQGPYGLLGASVKVSLLDFQVSIWSQNILDEQYRSFQFAAIGNVYAQPGMPRITGISLSYRLP
jgi:outer membrane receptor protein involved in Fe transport